MEESFVPFRGIKNDIHNRLHCYKQDWSGGFKAGFRYALSLSSWILTNICFTIC